MTPRVGDRVVFYWEGLAQRPGLVEPPSRSSTIVKVHSDAIVDIDVPIKPGDRLPGNKLVSAHGRAIVVNVQLAVGAIPTGVCTWKPIV